MKYYIGNLSFDSNYLEHYGVKGMKWGKHRARIRTAIGDWWTGRNKLTEAREHDKIAKQAFTNKLNAWTDYNKEVEDIRAERDTQLKDLYKRGNKPSETDVDKLYDEFGKKIDSAMQKAAEKNNAAVARYHQEREAAKKAREAYSRAPRQVAERLSSKGKAFIYRLLGKSPAPVVNKPRGGRAER